MPESPRRGRSQQVPSALGQKTEFAADESGSNRTTPLNFKVPVEFHREFKSYAAQHGISMVELLQEGFRLIKKQDGQ